MMGTPVILTPQAEEDLHGSIAFIARDNEERAHSFGDELVDKALRPGEHPQMGRVLPKQPDENVREIVHRSCRIISELIDSPPRLFILRFWHGARGNPQIVED